MNIKTQKHNRKQRQPFQETLMVSWQSRDTQRNVRVSCQNVSESGCQVCCPEGIAPRTVVFVKSAQHIPLGSASVRYCRRAGIKYQIGLEFTVLRELAPEWLSRYFRPGQQSSGE